MTTTEVWTYVGRRQGASRDIVHAWLDPEDSTLAYGKVKGSVIGGRYCLDVERIDSKTTVYPDTLTFTGERDPSDELRLTWEAADRTTMIAVERDRLERKQATDSEFDRAIAPLRDVYAKQTSYARRSAFVALVITELGRSR
jgi:hypothetical protein